MHTKLYYGICRKTQPMVLCQPFLRADVGTLLQNEAIVWEIIGSWVSLHTHQFVYICFCA